MEDETSKPGGGKGRGPRKPFAGREGTGKPASARDRDGRPPRKPDGAKRPFAAREGGGERPRKWERRDDTAAEGERRPPAKKPYAPRGGDDKPYHKPDGAKRPFAAREGGGERPRKWERRDDTAAEGERRPPAKKPNAPRGGDDKPYRKPDGAKRPFAAREGGGERPRKWERRDDTAAGGERRPPAGKPRAPRSEDEGKPYRRQDGVKRAFAGREGGAPGKARPGKRERAEVKESGGEPGGGERIARRLARAGISSRRDAEALIAEGRIRVNGKVLDSPAVNVSDRDRIELDGAPIPTIERTRLFLFHKPAGAVTTSRDPEGRKTVFDILPPGLPRLMTVGRLDINTEGLLLLTNDGGLARVLELPATGWLRRYRVRVHGKVDADALAALKDGIAVDGVFYGSIEAALEREQGSNAWLTIGLREGKNREVKNVLGALGLDVTRLIRVSFGPFQLGELAEGEVRELRGRTLREQLGERLIAEAGANFDAPVLNEFSNKPVAAEPRKKREAAGERPNRKREREERREDALDRLQTSRPARGGKPGGPAGDRQRKPAAKAGKPGTRDDRPAEQGRPRTSNVWMAPGARPVGEKKAAALAERNDGRRYAGKPRPAGKGGKPPSKPGPRKPRDGR